MGPTMAPFNHMQQQQSQQNMYQPYSTMSSQHRLTPTGHHLNSNSNSSNDSSSSSGHSSATSSATIHKPQQHHLTNISHHLTSQNATTTTTTTHPNQNNTMGYHHQNHLLHELHNSQHHMGQHHTMHLPNQNNSSSLIQAHLLSSSLTNPHLTGSTNTGTTPPISYYQANFQHHNQLQQQHLNQLQQQQQYNLNSSDYSSSTYHIYDQISDLKIIKQQRMERRRQLEQRRKVIILGLIAILLVGGTIFYLMSALFASSSPSQSTLAASVILATGNQMQSQSIQQPQNTQIIHQHQHQQQQQQQQQQHQHLHQHHHQQQQQQSHPQQHDDPLLNDGLPREWPAPSGGVKSGDHFDASRLHPASFGSYLPNIVMGQPVTPLSSACSGRGTLVAVTSSSELNPLAVCRCEAGFYGARCELQLSSQAASSALPAGRQTPTEAQRCSSERCNGLGRCGPDGRCQCAAGYGGDSCQLTDNCVSKTNSVDSSVCSNQGTCAQSLTDANELICNCHFGFTGPLCADQDPLTWPRLVNCSSRGQFDTQSRKCNCEPGFGGADCSEERCEPAAGQQVLDCGPNGLFDCRQNKCLCQEGYSGERCKLDRCSAQCLRNGQCVDGSCVCRAGFYGRHCSLNGCPNNCSNGRGQCVKTQNVAVISTAIQTASSSRDGGSAGSGASSSSVPEPEWRCHCPPGFGGDDCGQPIERICDDGIDNDQDGLVDCADSECCSDRACQNSTLCMKSPDPLDILMRKQPPSPTSSFFQRMQFLIEKFSSQQYTHPKDFNDSLWVSYNFVDRASVVRGRVTYLKQGVVGVRVSVAGQMSLGMTLTREGGYFDLMVNGGGAILLEFRREPFATHQRTLRVPWNEIVLADPVELQLDSSSPMANQTPALSSTSGQASGGELGDTPTCLAHNYKLLRPQVIVGPKWSRRSFGSSRSAGSGEQQQQPPSIRPRALVFRDSGIVQQSVPLPASGDSPSAPDAVSLVYSSSRANEFMSTIWVQLTPLELGAGGDELKLVHLRITIEGNLFEQQFEPAANLSFTWAWNRRNVYRQKSFGQSVATVSVGYEYFDCRQPIWSSRQVQLAGHELAVSDIGSQWSLNIHHRYNQRDSILQRGDGLAFNLKNERPRLVHSILGDGYQRPTSCPFCDQPEHQRLLRPQALVASPDGSLYLGDFNLIRRIEFGSPSSGKSSTSASSSGGRGEQRSTLVVNTKTVLEMAASRVPKQYGLALNPTDQRLYMTDSERVQVLLVRQETVAPTGNSSSSSSAVDQDQGGQLVPVVGSGQRCSLDDGSSCGDGGPASSARLIEPRAIAFDLQNRMYIADGPNVRMVDADGKIFTVLGHYGARESSPDRKWTCDGSALPAHQFVPSGPLDLAFDPIDNTLHLLDDNQVFKVTRDRRLLLVAGRSSQCSSSSTSNNNNNLKATESRLQFAQSIAFSQQGELFIVEDDQHHQSASRVLRVQPEEDKISLFAGGPASVSGNSDEQQLAAPSNMELGQARASNAHLNQVRATDFRFGSLAALAVDQSGRVLVADRRQLRLLSVEADLPQLNSQSGEFEIVSPDQPDELLVFNRFGHHVATRDLGLATNANASPATGKAAANKYTFTYNLNTSFGQLAAVHYATGNKISIFRDGPQHGARLIETALGGQCKLDISRQGQVHSISVTAPHSGRTSFVYQSEGGLLRQARDQITGEQFEFGYDEFGRANTITHQARAGHQLECHRAPSSHLATGNQSRSSSCNALIVAD